MSDLWDNIDMKKKDIFIFLALFILVATTLGWKNMFTLSLVGLLMSFTYLFIAIFVWSLINSL